METKKISLKYLIVWHAFLALAVLLFFAVLTHPASAISINFQEQYIDYLGNWHTYTDANLATYPYYIQNGTFASRMEDSLALNIPGAIYTFNLASISLKLNYTPTQINSRSTPDGVNWYIPIPESLYKTRFMWDNVKPTVSNDTGINLNSSNFWYDKSSGQLRFYYNQTARTFGINSKYVFFNFTTYIINNATTNGFTSVNVSLNGSMWQGDYSGSLALNHRNDSSLNISGLVLYYGMGENTGTTVHNVNTESGLINTTNQGTWNGNTTINSTVGKIGNATSFDGVNDYVNVGNDASLNITNEITLSAWVYIRENTPAVSKIVVKPAGSTWTFPYFYYSLGVGTGTIGNPQGQFSVINNTNEIFGGTNLDVDKWYFILGTYDGQIEKLYINGTLVNSKSVSGNIPTSFENLAIGARSTISPNELSNNVIDEVRIWNRALSPSEVAVLYNTSLRTQAMPVFMNQSAALGNVILNATLTWGGGNASNNASIYGRQNGTTSWTLIHASAVSGVNYNIPSNLQFNNMDFGILAQGDGTNTLFVESLVGGEASVSLPTIIISNTTGNFWVNHTTTLSGGNQTITSYNWSVNSVWTNGTTATHQNNTYTPHEWQNVTVCGYGGVNMATGACSSQNTQIPNNLPIPKTIHSAYLVDTGTTLNFTINATDVDSDTLVYNSNNTIGTFNTTTGNFTYTGIDADKGNYTFYFQVDDGYGGIVNQVTTITVQSTIDILLAAIKNQPVMVSSPGFEGVLPIIAFISLIVYKKLYYKRKY